MPGLNSPYGFFILAMVLAAAITIHEFSHAWVAHKLGDPTAKYKGRVSLNPLKHLDPLGTLMIFIAHIGWGKPVPVDPHYFKHPIRDNAIVSAAGPLSNLFTAILAGLPYQFFSMYSFPLSDVFKDFFGGFIVISVVLFLFNLLPFKPLDGAAILGYFVPKKHFYRYEKFMEDHIGHFLAFILIDMFLINKYLGFSIVGTAIFVPAQYIIQFIMIGG